MIFIEIFENVVNALDYVMDTERKRHITGGVFLSLSLFFGGLAATVLTTSKEDDTDE